MKRTSAALLALLLLAAAAPVAVRADDASDALAKHKAYTGYTFGDSRMMSLVAESQTILDKDKSVVGTQTSKSLGLLYRDDSHDVKSKADDSDGFTGNIFWRSDENGITVPIIGDPAKLALAGNLFFTDAVATLPWTSRGTAQVDGTTVQVYRVSPQGTFTIDLSVDPSTGAYKRAVIDAGGDNDTTIDVLGYVDAGPGLRMVGSWKTLGSRYTTTITKVTAGATVSTGDLHPPAQTAQWTFANAQAFPIRVSEKRVILKARVNGVDGTFLLDTGASNIFFSQAFADKVKVKSLGKGQASGIGGDLDITTGKVDTIVIGGNTLSNVVVFSGGKGVDTEAPDGLLGFDLLGAAFVTLDFANQTLRIQDPSTVDPASAPGVHVGADLSDGTPHVPFVVNGTSKLNAMLDMGAPFQVVLAYDYVFKHKITMLIRGGMGVRGVGGVEYERCGNLNSLALGPIVYNAPEACQSPSFGHSDGQVGFLFMREFASMTFDYPHSGIIFVPKP